MINITVINTRASTISVPKLGVTLRGNQKRVVNVEDAVLDAAIVELDLFKKKGLIDYVIKKNDYENNQFDTAIPSFTTAERLANKGKFRIVYDTDVHECFSWRDDIKDYSIMGSGVVTRHVHLNKINEGEFGTGGHTGMVQRIEAKRDPTLKDDLFNSANMGINILHNAIWVNITTKDIFICLDNIKNTARWVNLLGSGSVQENVILPKEGKIAITVGDSQHRTISLEYVADYLTYSVQGTVTLLQRDTLISISHSHSTVGGKGTYSPMIISFTARVVNDLIILDIHNAARETVSLGYFIKRMRIPVGGK